MRREPVDLADTAAAALEAGASRPPASACGSTWSSNRRPSTATRALLERLAANLIENGVRYNRPGGFVIVRTRAVDGAAELLVENSGPPVGAAEAARLAEPFERVERDADGRGAGLGLSIVSAVGEAHGGTLAIEPRPDGGLWCRCAA